MIVQFIGICVIVMSRYFYDDSYLLYDQKQDSYEEDVRKFFQTTIPSKSEFLQTFEESKIKKMHINFEIPEVYKDVYSVLSINNRISNILSGLYSFLVKYKGYINICIIFLNNEYLKEGVYFLGLTGDLYWIKEVDKKLIQKLDEVNATFTINYYIDLKNAVFLEKSYGFINALQKIGGVSEYIDNLSSIENYEVNDIFFNPNMVTKLMGLNLINQIYIRTDAITVL